MPKPTKTKDIGNSPRHLLKMVVRIFLGLVIIAGVILILVGSITYRNDADLKLHIATIQGTVTSKSNNLGRDRYTGPQYYIHYSFQPPNSSLIYSNFYTLYDEGVANSIKSGTPVLIYYDSQKPEINYAAGYQSTPHLDKILVLVGIVMVIVPLIILKFIW